MKGLCSSAVPVSSVVFFCMQDNIGNKIDVATRVGGYRV